MIKDSLISVAGLIGRPVVHKDGQEVGRLVDLVFRWDTGQAYPPLSGILVRVGRRLAWISASEIEHLDRRQIQLRTTRLDLRDFQGREGEARLAQDVLDHQLVDVSGARVVRASDLYITTLGKTIHLVGVDVGYSSLLRRLGPARWRSRPASGAVLDWATIQSFGRQTDSGKGLRLAGTHQELRLLRPSELADLLEDLGRSERQELLSALPAEKAADALEEMQPEELESILRESTPSQAAGHLARMEPDEAADALRDVDAQLREDLLALMPEKSTAQVERVLSYEEDAAGGFMTTAIVTARPDETIQALQKRLLKRPDRHQELEAIVVTSASGQLLGDIPVIKLFLAAPSQALSELNTDLAPVTVSPNATIEEVAELLIANRRSSVLVVDERNQPLGRILADDVVDALLPARGHHHFPRVLS